MAAGGIHTPALSFRPEERSFLQACCGSQADATASQKEQAGQGARQQQLFREVRLVQQQVSSDEGQRVQKLSDARLLLRPVL